MIMASAQARAGGNRRTTELALLFAAAIPVILIYAMYLINSGTPVTLRSLAIWHCPLLNVSCQTIIRHR